MRIVFLITFFFIASCLPSEAKEKVLDIQEITSPGGIKAWLVEDKSVPIISLRFKFIGAGAVNNSEKQQGLTRLLSNTMDEGAGNLDSQAFQKALNDNSISLRFSAGRDNFGGHVETLSRHKEKAFNLLKLSLNEPRFDEEPLERMRKANISRILSSKSNPSWINARIFNDIAFEGHPYALNSGGTLTTLKSITADDLRNYKNSYLTKDRLIVSATGDISSKELKNIIDKVFGELPETGKKTTVKKYKIQHAGKTFLFKKDIPQTIISTAVPSISKHDPDYYAFQVMNSIFGSSGFGSRLMDEIREKRGLTYGIYSSAIEQKFLSGFEVSTSTKNKSVKETLEIIKQEMNKMTSDLVTEEEIKDAKAYIIGSLPLSMTSTSSISGIIHSLQSNKRPTNYLDTFADNINKVTREDIQRVAKRILKPKNLTTILVGDPQNLKKVKIIDEVPNVE